MSKKFNSAPHLLNGEEIIGSAPFNILHKSYTGESIVHWHDFYELEIICGGEGVYEVNGKSTAVSRCCAYIVTPKDYHKLSAGNADMYTISFSKEAVDWEILYKLNNCQNGIVVRFEEEEFERIERVLALLEVEFEAKRQMSEKVIKNLLEYILISLLRTPMLTDGKAGEMSTAIMKAVAYIKSNFKDDIKIKDVANKADVSPNYLGMLFKKELNVTFSQYLNATRLTYACSLLRDKRYRVKDIAYASGFVSHAYFGAVFKKQYGCSPLQMRKTFENDI